MSYKVLTSDQVEQFIEKGWVKVEAAFSREKAEAARENVLWDKLKDRGVTRNDKTSWTQPMVQINENYRSPDFDACNTQRMADAIEDLIGPGRYQDRVVYDGTEQRYPGWGWWPVNFAKGADQEWDVPKGGWHWDGIHFRHYVHAPEQGLLCLCLFSDIESRGGGTLIVEGSHKAVARFLSQQPDGIDLGEGIKQVNRQHPYLAALTGNDGAETTGSRVERFMERTETIDGISLRVIETTGAPGDAILCHPFLYHAASQNHLGAPRFMCNRTTPLKDRMRFDREAGDDHSPLENSIRRALGIA